MKAFCIMQMVNGVPSAALGIVGYALAAELPREWGLYYCGGSDAQINNLLAQANVWGVARKDVLDNVIPENIRTKINNWLRNRGYPEVPQGWTFGRLLREIYERMNQRFDLDGVDIIESVV